MSLMRDASRELSHSPSLAVTQFERSQRQRPADQSSNGARRRDLTYLAHNALLAPSIQRGLISISNTQRYGKVRLSYAMLYAGGPCDMCRKRTTMRKSAPIRTAAKYDDKQRKLWQSMARWTEGDLLPSHVARGSPQATCLPGECCGGDCVSQGS